MTHEQERPEEISSNYKLGLFYYNKEDKRVVVPKKLKWMGWTINFAQPLSYVIVIATIILLYFLITRT